MEQARFSSPRKERKAQRLIVSWKYSLSPTRSHSSIVQTI